MRRALVLCPEPTHTCTHTCTDNVTVTHLWMVAVSESLGVWFVPKPVVVNTETSGCDMVERWRHYLSSHYHWYPSMFVPQTLRSLQQEAYLCFLWSSLWSLSYCMCEMPRVLLANYRMSKKNKSLFSCQQGLFTPFSSLTPHLSLPAHNIDIYYP